MADDDVTISIGAKIDQLIDAVNQSKDKLGEIGESGKSIAEQFTSVKEAIATAFGLNEVSEFISRMAELGEQTKRTMELLGINSNAVSQLSVIAAATGSTLEGLTMSVERVAVTIQRASKDAFAPASVALNSLGLSAASFKNLNADQFLDKIAAAAAKSNQSAFALTQTLQNLGLRGSSALIAIAKEGPEGLDRLRKAADDAGVAMTEHTIKALNDLNIASIVVKGAFTSLGAEIVAAIAPTLTAAATATAKWVTNIAGLISTGKLWEVEMLHMQAIIVELQGWMQLIQNIAQVVWTNFLEFVKPVTDAIKDLIEWLQKIWDKVTGLGSGIISSLAPVAGKIREWIGSSSAPIDTASADWKVKLTAGLTPTFTQVQAEWDKGLNNIKTSTAEFEKQIAAISAKAQADIKASTSQQGHGGEGTPDYDGRDKLNAAMKAIDEEIKLYQLGLDKKKLVLEQEASFYQITQDKKFSLLQQFTEKEYQQELDALHREALLPGLKLAQQTEINNKILQLQATHDNAMVKLDQQSVQAMAANWQTALGSITTAFNSQLRGLLTGTTTWAAAFKNIITDLLVKFISVVEEMGVKWAAGQLAEVTATQSGAAAKAAAQTAGEVSTLPTRVAAFTSAITADAAQTFAGIFANLAPVLGPAASGPAEAGSASVLAQLAAVPKLAQGAWNVDADKLAYIHKSEMVIPASPAAQIRDAVGGAAGGGGGTVHLSISALDASSFTSWLNSGGGRQITKWVGQGFSRNPSLRPTGY